MKPDCLNCGAPDATAVATNTPVCHSCWTIGNLLDDCPCPMCDTTDIKGPAS